MVGSDYIAFFLFIPTYSIIPNESIPIKIIKHSLYRYNVWQVGTMVSTWIFLVQRLYVNIDLFGTHIGVKLNLKTFSVN